MGAGRGKEEGNGWLEKVLLSPTVTVEWEPEGVDKHSRLWDPRGKQCACVFDKEKKTSGTVAESDREHFRNENEGWV